MKVPSEDQNEMPCFVTYHVCLHCLLMQHMRGIRERGRIHLENHKAKWFLSNTGTDLLENHKATKVSIQCWAIIGPLAKRHLNGVRWWTDDGPF